MTSSSTTEIYPDMERLAVQKVALCIKYNCSFSRLYFFFRTITFPFLDFSQCKNKKNMECIIL